MTDPRRRGHYPERARPIPKAEHDRGTGRPFLTVIARAPMHGEAVPIDHLQELLAAALQLLLFPASHGWEASGCCDGFSSALDADATLTFLPKGPAETTMAAEPKQWLDAALRSLGCRPDAIDLETTVVVTEDLHVLIPGQGESQELQVLCDLSREGFSLAWNRYLERAAPAATQSRVVDVLCEVESNESGTARGHDLAGGDLAARIAKLEGQLRELSHERSVLRENRDFAREEHMCELQVHSALNGKNSATVKANQRELEMRAERIDELQEAVSTLETHHESELHAYREAMESSQSELVVYDRELELRAIKLKANQDELLVRATINNELQEAVDSLEVILHRTRAVQIAKWLDRLGALRRRLPGGGR
jgi:hypothetical protein